MHRQASSNQEPGDATPKPPHPRAFISYSHDTPEHSERVLKVAYALRTHGINVELDQFHTEEIVDWPRWCRQQISRKCSDFVLCVCTEEYINRIEGNVPPERGKSAYWEGSLLDDEVYDEKRNRRIIPILFDDEPETSILPFLRGWTFCRLCQSALSDVGYEQLVRILTGQASVVRNELGEIPKLPPRPFPSAGLRPTGGVLISPTRLRHGAETLFGREEELLALDAAWNDPRTHVVTSVAWGGVGKTSLVIDWMARMAQDNWRGAERVYDWSFYSQGTREQGAASADAFVADALKFFGDKDLAESPASPWDKGARLAQLVAQRRTLLVLDGLEPLQYPPGPMSGKLKDPAIESLLKGLAQNNPGLCIVTTREPLTDLAPFNRTTAPESTLEHLSEEAGADLLRKTGVEATDAELRETSREVNGHAFALDDPVKALEIGLTEIPKECRLALDIRWALDTGRKLKDWRAARKAVDQRFPGMHPVHTNNNACLTIFGLILGQKDLTRTVGITVAMGLDNDCTAATAGSLLGAVLGAKNIPEYWWKPFHNKTRTYLKGRPWFVNTDIVNRFLAAAKTTWAS